MTTGEQLSETSAEENAGVAQVDDADLRYRYGLAHQWAGNTAWGAKNARRRLMSDTVFVEGDSGVGNVPTTYGSPGARMKVTVVGDRIPLPYANEGELFALLRSNPNGRASKPRCWTMKGQSIEGFARIYVYPINSIDITLQLDNYVSKAPTMVDRPGLMTAAAGDATEAIPDGAYDYACAFRTADGITETGPRVTITVEATRINLSEIQSIATPFTGSRICLSRMLYRTEAGGSQLKFLAEIEDMTTTTYVDNAADADLGDDAPTVLNAVTGLERFPETFHPTLMRDLLRLRLARNKGDGRTPELSQAVRQEMNDMWNDENTPFTPGRTPRYGAGRIARRGCR